MTSQRCPALSFLSICLAVVLFVSSARAEEPQQGFEKALIDATLLGCLPNAMGLLPITPDNTPAVLKAGLHPVKHMAAPKLAAVVQQLALQPNPQIAMAEQAPFIVVASPNVHACRIAVINTPTTHMLRAALRAELEHKEAPWKLTASEQKNGISMQSYTWQQTDNKPDLMINISGPDSSHNEGKGLQLIITVAQAKRS